MKFIPQVGDVVTYTLNDGRIIGGTIESFDGDNQIIRFEPDDFEVVNSSDICSANFGMLYPVCSYSKGEIVSIPKKGMITDYTEIGSGYFPSPSTPAAPVTPPKWDHSAKKWHHPIGYSCGCNPNCRGGWSNSATGPL